MDNRLQHRGGFRRLPSNVFDVDLPEMAKAITAVSRKQATIGVSDSKGVQYVRIHGVGINVCVDSKHWALIMPHLQQGYFESAMFPVEAGFATFDPATRFDVATLDIKDPLYMRVLFALTLIFPEKMPLA